MYITLELKPKDNIIAGKFQRIKPFKIECEGISPIKDPPRWNLRVVSAVITIIIHYTAF